MTVRFFFKVTLKRHDLAEEVVSTREPRRLPVVLSPEEVGRLLASARNIKHKALLSLAYATGLRASEESRARDHLPDGGAGHPVGRSVLASVTRSAVLMLALVVAQADVGPVSAREHRSRQVTREFQREHPCPSTGQTSGPFPGYWKDHIVPLACGGPDTVFQPPMADDCRCKG
jgi:hypothetical protein